MKIKKLFFSFVGLTLASTALCSCDGTKANYKNRIKVIYNLNGGTYRNTTGDVVEYFDLDKNKENKIYDLTTISGEKVTYPKYELEGWYKKVVLEDGSTTDVKWDFSVDTVGKDGITLYANWVPITKWTYSVIILNDNNEEVCLGSYDVKPPHIEKNDAGEEVMVPGDKFNDYLDFADNFGYTPIYYDAEGKLWDNNFEFPETTESLNVKVYVKYLEGDYYKINTKDDFINAFEVESNPNLFLESDIDMEGTTIKFGDYQGKIIGNNHKISNLVISKDIKKSDMESNYDDGNPNAAYVSLFGNSRNVSIKDVEFENVLFDIKCNYKSCKYIYIAPFAVKTYKSTFTNVKFSGKYKTTLYSEFTEENVIVSIDPVYNLDEESNINDCQANISKKMED